MDRLWAGYPVRFVWGTACPEYSDWCTNPNAHAHGLNCDKECPCRVERGKWDRA